MQLAVVFCCFILLIILRLVHSVSRRLQHRLHGTAAYAVLNLNGKDGYDIVKALFQEYNRGELKPLPKRISSGTAGRCLQSMTSTRNRCACAQRVKAVSKDDKIPLIKQEEARK